jgi:glyoxylate utilization-related uncharacterized protein
VTITVLEVASVPASPDGVRPFLNAETVGAQLVEGEAHELPPGRSREAAASDRHQVVFVTAGRLSAVFQEEVHELLPGRGVYCEPGEGCALENVGNEPAEFYRFAVARS